jgi:hypothetical protein
MNFRERWRIAGIIAQEVRLQGYLDSNPAYRAKIKEDPDKLMNQIKSATRMNTFFTTMIMGVLAIMAIATSAQAIFESIVADAVLAVTLSISIFLLFGFVLIFFLNLLTTTGFFLSGTATLPSILPIGKTDVGNLIYLAFLRVFVAPAILLITIFPIGSGILFGPVMGLIAFIACGTTMLLSTGALVSASKWYHKKTHVISDSKISTVVRVLAGLGLVVGMVGVYSIGSFQSMIMDWIIASSIGTDSPIFMLLSLIFPFSFGIVSGVTIAGMTIPLPTFLLALGASSFYGLLAIVSYRRSGRSLRYAAFEGVPIEAQVSQRDVAIDIKTPVFGVIRKDMKLATRSLGSMIIFAMPFFMLIVLVPMIGALLDGVLRSTTALIAVGYSSSFSGVVVVGMLMFDTQGASIYDGLPVSSHLNLKAKAYLFEATFMISMIGVSFLLFMAQPITPLIIFMPLIQILSGYAIAMTVGTFVYRVRGGGRMVATNIATDQAVTIGALLVGALVSALPLIGYAGLLLVSGNHIFALTGQLLVAILELAAVWFLVPKLLKD